MRVRRHRAGRRYKERRGTGDTQSQAVLKVGIEGAFGLAGGATGACCRVHRSFAPVAAPTLVAGGAVMGSDLGSWTVNRLEPQIDALANGCDAVVRNSPHEEYDELPLHLQGP